MSWQVFALGSAFFAALTTILAKVGVENVNSNLATAIRTAVILAFACALVSATNGWRSLAQLDRRTWIFLVLSGLATGASWLCYFRALQMAPVAKVAPVDKFSLVLALILAAVFLREKFDARMILGAVFISIGTLLLLPKK